MDIFDVIDLLVVAPQIFDGSTDAKSVDAFLRFYGCADGVNAFDTGFRLIMRRMVYVIAHGVYLHTDD